MPVLWFQPVNVERRGLALMWWQSWVERFAIQLPWVLCIFAYLKFLDSEQGGTALEYPVEAPVMGILIVGAMVGMCAEAAQQLSLAYRSTMLKPPLITVASALLALREQRVLIDDPASSIPTPRRWAGVAYYALLSGILGSGVLTVASISETSVPTFMLLPLFVIALTAGAAIWYCAFGIAFVVPWVLQKALRTTVDDAVQRVAIAIAPIGLTVAVYMGGIYLVSHNLGVLTGLGSHAIVASGLLTITLACQAVLLLLMMQASLRAGWLLLAIGVSIYLLQHPIEERLNPLLVTPPVVQRTQSTCGRLSSGPQTASDAQQQQAPREAPVSPSILVSAEGGGIRAAYWTALSLEEITQAREIPLVDDANIFSGVSGGGLGIATFLAAQQLPQAARLPCIREFLSGDFLSPLLTGLLFLDVPRLILPAWVLGTHRGDYFEEFIARRWLTLTGSDYFYRVLTRAAGDSLGDTTVYLNATDALSGRHVALIGGQAPTANVSEQPNLSALNLAVLDQLPGLRIAQAVHMSARFPYLSPSPDLRVRADKAPSILFERTASTLKARGRMSLASLVDGGYFDNSGLWPALRLLEREAPQHRGVPRFVLHIVNDQTRGCRETPSNTGCIRAEAEAIKERRSIRGGHLLRPLQALQAVRSEHSLQSLTALELAQRRSTAIDALVWKAPMPQLIVHPKLIDMLLDLAQWLPLHGADLRYGGVALAWTLAPREREFLCAEAAKIRATNVPGIKSMEHTDRSQECYYSLK